MNTVQIKNINDLIKLDNGKTIIDHKVKRLTAPGENYGSLMLSVDLTVKTAHENEKIHTVAKMLPPSKFIQELFNTNVTFRNEIGFYRTIIPLLQNFQREHGVTKVIDIAPRYYGSRLNLEDDNTVSDDTVLVLENLKIENYMVLNRFEGTDLDVTELILGDLAELHGVALALKLQKPDVFDNEIKPLLTPWKCIPSHYAKLKKDLHRLIDHVEELQPFRENIDSEFDQQMVVKEAREPYATISHNDCWIANNMVKFDGGKAVKNKMVDYQLCSYGSPARDVLFLLFTTVKNDLVDKQYDYLIKFYHRKFISILEELKCDTTQFSFEAFEKELDYEARNSQFAHVAFMLFPVFANKENAKEVADMTPENIISEEISDLLKEKFVIFVNQFVKRKWIYN